MKKFCYLFLTALSALLAAGAYAVHYFSCRKMGMARYVLYKSQRWEAAWPLERLRLACVIALAVLALAVAALWLSRRRLAPRSAQGMAGAALVLSALLLWFLLARSFPALRDYYFISPLLLAAVLLQLLQAALALLTEKKPRP